jgi:hypothetical protein
MAHHCNKKIVVVSCHVSKPVTIAEYSSDGHTINNACFSPMTMAVPASDVITWLSLSLYRKIYKFIDIELAFFEIILECLFI